MKTVNVKKYFAPLGNYVADIQHPFKIDATDVLLKHMNLVCRIRRINILCENHYEVWNRINKSSTGEVKLDMFFLQEEIIFHFRKVVDDIISLSWVIDEYTRIQQNVEVVKVDCIGQYLKNPDIIPYLKKYVDFFEKLNGISNAYKHSYLQTMNILIGRDEPCFYSVSYKNNNLKNMKEEYGISQNELMESLEAVFDDFEKNIR